jgi:hypothetical protein
MLKNTDPDVKTYGFFDEEDCDLVQYIFDRLKGELVGEEELVVL